jgi:hypothetical protein
VGTRNYQSYTDQLLVELLCKDDAGAFKEITGVIGKGC